MSLGIIDYLIIALAISNLVVTIMLLTERSGLKALIREEKFEKEMLVIEIKRLKGQNIIIENEEEENNND